MRFTDFRGDRIVSYHSYSGKKGIVIGSYSDQFPWGDEDRGRKIYSVHFEDEGPVSWVDEKYMTLITGSN